MFRLRCSNHLFIRHSSRSLSSLFTPTPTLLSQDKKKDPEFIEYDEMNKATIGRISSIINSINMAKASTPKEDRHLNPMLAEWVATEKVHGSNFGIYLTQGCSRFRLAKRSDIMDPRDQLFGYQSMHHEMERWARKILTMLNEEKIHKPGYFPSFKNRNNKDHQEESHLKKSDDAVVDGSGLIDTLVINGELAGAQYKHPDIPVSKVSRRHQVPVIVKEPNNPPQKWSDIQPPQKDSFPQISNDLIFVAFDIRYRLKNDKTNKVFCVPYDQAQEIFERLMTEERERENEHRFFYNKPLLRGPLEEIIMFDVQNTVSTLPLLLGFGEYPFKNNYSEGVVIRNTMHGHPEINTEAISTIIKYKNSRFNELKHKAKDGTSLNFKDDLGPLKASLSRSIEKKLPRLDAVFRSGEDVAQCEKLCAMVTEHNNNTSTTTKDDSGNTKTAGEAQQQNNNNNEDDEDAKVLKELPFRLRSIIEKNGGVDAARVGDLTKNRAEYLLAQNALSEFLQSSNDEKVVAMPILQRREMTRYLWWECKKVVAREWKKHQFFGEQQEEEGSDMESNDE